MNKRMILVTPEEALYCDRYLTIIKCIEESYEESNRYDCDYLQELGSCILSEYLIFKSKKYDSL